MGSTLRTFVAINIPANIKQELARVQDLFRHADIGVRWVRPEGLHVTLKFLGEVEEERIAEIRSVMVEAARGASAFTLELTEVDAFPNARYPRIIWMGLEDASGELQRLQEKLDKGFRKLGFEPEGREYSPHLTMGRVAASRGRGQLIRLLHTEKRRHGGIFEVSAVDPMRSTLTPAGAEYALLGSVPLGGNQEGPEVLTAGKS